jgi:hypothetical protein
VAEEYMEATPPNCRPESGSYTSSTSVFANLSRHVAEPTQQLCASRHRQPWCRCW